MSEGDDNCYDDNDAKNGDGDDDDDGNKDLDGNRGQGRRVMVMMVMSKQVFLASVDKEAQETEYLIVSQDINL